jgi:cytochrome c oxidase cbb3-type subunit 3
MLPTSLIRALGVSLLAAGSALMAQEAKQAPLPILKRPEVMRGQAAFQSNCAACHGANATGSVGPNLITSATVRHDVNGDEIGKVVHEGRMDKGMPAFPNLTTAQVADIAAFLHARVTLVSRPSALSGSTVGVAALGGGNAAAGQKWFEAKCARCHSPMGDLKGVATKLAGPDLLTMLLLPPSSPTKQTGSVTPKSGAAVKGTFVHRDAFTVTLRLADDSTHTWMTKDVTVAVDDPLKGHRDLLPTYTDKDLHDVLAYLQTLR